MVILYYHICVYAMPSVTFFAKPDNAKPTAAGISGQPFFARALPIGDAASFRPAANKKPGSSQALVWVLGD